MSIRFDGTGADNLNRAISFSADTGTIMAWVRIVTDRNAFTSFFNPRQTANQEVLIQTDATGTLLGLWQANVMTTGSSLTVGQWYHLAIINSSTACTVYLDGVQNITRAHSAGALNWTQIYLGTNALATTEALNGNIGIIKAWNATLTAAEIVAEMRRILPQRYNNIVGWWPTFTGERTIDYSRQGNLTQVGTVTDEANPSVSWGASPIVVPITAAAVVTNTITANLEALAQRQGLLATTTLNAAGQTRFTTSTTLEAVAQIRLSSTAQLDAAAALSNALSGTLDAAAQKRLAATLNLEALAVLRGVLQSTLDANAQARQALTTTFEALGELGIVPGEITAALDAVAQTHLTTTTGLDALARETKTITASFEALGEMGAVAGQLTALLDAAGQIHVTATVALEARGVLLKQIGASIDALALRVQAATATFEAAAQATAVIASAFDAAGRKTLTVGSLFEARAILQAAVTAQLDAAALRQLLLSATFDAIVGQLQASEGQEIYVPNPRRRAVYVAPSSHHTIH